MGAGLGMLVLGIAVLLIARGGGDGLPFGSRVAVVELKGVIQDATDTLDELERLRKDDGAVAVVLRIDSPGGAVAPSQELYDALLTNRNRDWADQIQAMLAGSGDVFIAVGAAHLAGDDSVQEILEDRGVQAVRQ